MSARPTKEQIVQDNPLVDEQKLDEYLALIRELRKCGVKRAAYDLSQPFSQTMELASKGDARPEAIDLGLE